MPNSKRASMSADTKLRTVEEKFNIGTWSWDLKTSEVTWSQGMFRIVGMDPSTIVPSVDVYQSLVHPDDQLDFSNAIGLATGKVLQDRTFRIIRPDGSMRWVRSKGQPYFDRAGTAISMFGVIADVTEIQTMQISSARDAALRSALIALLGGQVWRAHPDGKLVETTDWSKLTGQTPAEARDWEKLAAIHPEDRQTFRDAWSLAIANKDRFDVTMRVRNLEGRYVRLNGHAVPIVGDDGKVEEWLGYTQYGGVPAARDEDFVLGPAQIRGARALLGWSAVELAKHSGVSFSTIRRMEIATETVRKDALSRVRDALKRAGVNFFQDRSGGILIGLRDVNEVRS
ncbi:PAS domain-containing protein [Agrobacterium rosae]|uniref:PAS domain-containing protein n=1 Tax=Agrobacterium rosae TaxID=1972867 RepID=UPI0019D33B4A|nr:PAS domain-containing protein [Agrobacterium rosae]MBN7808377.1 PAS domain-containing protein [Agrobacterium rosae]